MVPLILFSITGVMSLACIVHLWTIVRGSTLRKLGWTIAIALPAIGPVLYGALYKPPSIQAESARANESYMI